MPAAAPSLKRLLVLYDEERACAERLIAAGHAEDVAREIALYLAQEGDLETELPAIRAAFGVIGVEVVSLPLFPLDGWIPLLRADPADTVLWTVTDGFAWYRGSHAHAVASLAGAATYGSEAGAGLTCQDKARSMALIERAGARVPPWALHDGTGWRTDPAELGTAGPFFVKPNRLGAKIGIWQDSRCTMLDEAIRIAGRIRDRYGDRAIVQRFVDGTDVRVSFMSQAPAGRDAHGIFAVRATAGAAAGFMTLDDSLSLSRLAEAAGSRLGISLEDLADRPELAPAVARIRQDVIAIAGFAGLRDYWSMDLRLDAAGRPWFLEFEVAPAVTIYDFRRYLAVRHGSGLAEALVRSVPAAHRRAQLIKD
jgi:D-alanine-D-alanine ligase